MSAALTVWGADAERVCVPERYAVEVPEDLDPAEVVSLVFPYMTAYQLLHRVARAKSGETVLVHGAAGRVGTAVLELGALAGLRLYGTASARDRAAVEKLGAVAIDYRNEDFVARVRGLPGERGGCCARRPRWRDVDSLLPRAAARWKAGRVRLLLRAHAGAQEPASVAQVERADRERLSLGPALAPPAGGHGYRIDKLRNRHPEWFREDFLALLELLRGREIHPVVSERLSLTEVRRAHELLESSAATGKLVLVP